MEGWYFTALIIFFLAFFASNGNNFRFGVLSLIISAYIVFLISQSTSILEIYSLSMILGGALGNGYDRLLQGYVIDFIDIYYIDYHWPAFNIADSCITVGFVIMIL